MGATSSTQFLVSERCDRILADNDIYYQSSAAGQFTMIDQMIQFTHVDHNLTYTIGGYSIFRYNPTTHLYDPIYKRTSG